MNSDTGAFPEWLVPMAATLTQERFTGPEWIFERKFDGIRLLAFKREGEVQLFSRNRLPQHIPTLARAIADLPVRNLILDGEVTWDRTGGYHVFDIIWIDGRNVTALPLEERRALLGKLPLTPPLYRVTEVESPNPWEVASSEGWEGVIAKRRGSPYEHRRSKHWLKMKCEATQELVVGGFTDPQGSRVGLRRAARRLFRQGRFRVRRQDRHRLRHEAAARSPRDDWTRSRFRNRHSPKPWACRASARTGSGPKIVVHVAFIEWTVHGKLRHPRLLGVVAPTVAWSLTAPSLQVAVERRDHASREGAVS